MVMKQWNKLVFGRLQTKINDIRVQIAANQSSPPTADSLQKDKALQDSLDGLLLKEQILWRDKAKELWLEEGDQNSRYFHVSTIIRRRKNHIAHLLNRDHVAVTDCDEIGQVFVDFYKDLFSSSNHVIPPTLVALFPDPLSTQNVRGIADIPSPEEIQQAVFSMSNGKSPGSNGMSPLFFKTY